MNAKKLFNFNVQIAWNRENNWNSSLSSTYLFIIYGSFEPKMSLIKKKAITTITSSSGPEQQENP